MKNNIRSLREARKLSQSDLGIYVGIAPDFISKFERQVTNPWPSAMLVISNYFDLEPSEVFPDDWIAYENRKNKKDR